MCAVAVVGGQGSRSALPSHSTRREVDGLTTPSATWDTGEDSHPVWNVTQQFGMYGPWNVEEEVDKAAAESNVMRVVPVDTGGHPNGFFFPHTFFAVMRAYAQYDFNHQVTYQGILPKPK